MTDLPPEKATFYRATALRPGGVGVFYLTGRECDMVDRLDAVFCRGQIKLRLGDLKDESGNIVDSVVVGNMGQGRRTLTCHGGVEVCRAVTVWLRGRGFVERAPELPFLAQCDTEAQAALLLEKGGSALGNEELRLLRLRKVCLAGSANAGKSSLLNALTGHDRAFVHPEAGATRDMVSENMNLGGHWTEILDLPGLDDLFGELAGLARKKALDALATSEVTVHVVDGSRTWSKADAMAAGLIARATKGRGILVVLNKSDLGLAIPGKPWEEFFTGPVVYASARDGSGIAELVTALSCLLQRFL